RTRASVTLLKSTAKDSSVVTVTASAAKKPPRIFTDDADLIRVNRRKSAALRMTSKIFMTDVGNGIVGQHIDVFSGTGRTAEEETFRITSNNNRVCFTPSGVSREGR